MYPLSLVQGLCGEGGGGAMVDAGDNTYGGKYVVNPSGRLISIGHPLGATGLAQCTESNSAGRWAELANRRMVVLFSWCISNP